MSFETLKEQVDLLADAERRRLMAYLVSVEHSKSTEHAERMKHLRAKRKNQIPISNNLEMDHADIFDSVTDIQLAFRRFINVIPRGGLLLAKEP